MRNFIVKLRWQGEGIRHTDYQITLRAKDWEDADKKALAIWEKHPEKFSEVHDMTVYIDDDGDDL